MPRRTATLQRWQVVAAFVVVTATFAGTAIWLGALTERAHHLAVLDAEHARAADKIRHDLVARIQETEQKSCRSRHRLTVVLTTFVKRSLAQTEHIHIPGVTKQELERARELDRQFLRDLAKADCTKPPELAVPKNPPPLPVKTPHVTTGG